MITRKDKCKQAGQDGHALTILKACIGLYTEKAEKGKLIRLTER